MSRSQPPGARTALGYGVVLYVGKSMKKPVSAVAASIFTSACVPNPPPIAPQYSYAPPAIKSEAPAAIDASLKLKTEEAVRSRLKDPRSAEFADIRVHRYVNLKGNSDWAICGMVNAKNSFGGYTGMTPFVYLPDAPASIQVYINHGRSMSPGDVSHIVYQNTCLQPGRA